MIEAKTLRLCGRDFKIQQDEARPQTGTNTVEKLQEGGTGDWKRVGSYVLTISTQPPTSPDVNINDLGLFSLLKYHVQICSTHCSSSEEMMANVIRVFGKYPADKSERKWACCYINLRSIISCFGGNDYKQAHNGGKRDRQDTRISVKLSISLDNYDSFLENLDKFILFTIICVYFTTSNKSSRLLS
jgi:hypothetical protein